MDEKQETINFRTLYFFCIGIFISCIILSPFVLDFTLNTRLICLSLTLLITTWKLQKESSMGFAFSFPVFVYTIFIVWNLMGITWALNVSEAISDSVKTLTAWVVFMCVIMLYRLFSDKLTISLGKTIAGISIVLFIAFAWQLASVGSFKKEFMYSVTGLNGHKNLFSSFLFLAICFLLYSWNSVSTKWKGILAASVILNAVVILVLRTKAVYIGLICASVFYIISFFLSKRKFSKTTLIVIGAVLLLTANFFFIKILPFAIDKSLEIAGQSGKPSLLSVIDEERLVLWKKTYHIINEHPFLGTGPGNWQVWFPDATLTGIWRAEDLNFTFQRPHNDLLWILSETGYVGLNLWLIFLISVLLFIFHSAQSKKDFQSKHRLHLLASVVTGFTIMSFFDFPKERIEHITWFSIILAIACSDLLPAGQKGIFKVSSYFLTAILSAISILSLFAGICRYSGEYYVRKLYASKNMGDHSQVIKAAEKAKNPCYTLDPTSIPVSWYSGNAYASLGDYEKARQELETAYKENPFNRNVLNDMGSALIFSGDTTSALKFYTEAARISPRYDEPRLNLAAICMARKKYDEAGKWLGSLTHDSERRTKYEKILELLSNRQ